MSLNDVSYFQMLVCSICKHREIDELAICSLDIFSSWPIICSSIHEVPQMLSIVLCDDLWNRELHSNLNWHTKLV